MDAVLRRKGKHVQVLDSDVDHKEVDVSSIQRLFVLDIDVICRRKE